MGLAPSMEVLASAVLTLLGGEEEPPVRTRRLILTRERSLAFRQGCEDCLGPRPKIKRNEEGPHYTPSK